MTDPKAIKKLADRMAKDPALVKNIVGSFGPKGKPLWTYNVLANEADVRELLELKGLLEVKGK